MAITYGSIEGRLSVGIDVSMSPASVGSGTSSVTLTWKVYARSDSYGFNDPQTMTMSNAFSATKNYTMVSGSVDDVVLLVGTWTQTVNTSYSGTVTKTLVASASGLFNGGTPSHSRSIVIPKRPPATPSPPTNPTVTLTSASTSLVDWDRASNADSAATLWSNVIVERSVNGGSYTTVATLAGSASNWSDSGLAVNTTYSYRVSSKNATGSSAAVDAGSIQTALLAPTAITPAAGATVTVPNPTLGGTMSAIAGGILQKMEWELATNSSFTAGNRFVVEGDGDFKASGATTETPSILNLALTSGTWYVRGRVRTANGGTGPWSAGNSFTVNVPALPVPTTVTPAAASTVTLTRPLLGATLVADTAGRLLKAEWQLATNSGFTANVVSTIESDADFKASGATTEYVTAPGGISTVLGGTWYLRARSVGNDGSVSAWTATQTFTANTVAPPAPTNLTPATGGPVIVSNTPTLGATVAAASEDRLSKIEWQLATNVGFTTNVRTVTQSNAALRSLGATTEPVPFASKLFQGTWYMRARQIDEYGQAGAYAATQTFTVSHAPAGVPQTPSAGAMYPYASPFEFTWLFTDSSPLDVQTAYQIIVENNATGATVLDTGKVISGVKAGSHVIPAGSKDVTLRWKIKLWDTDDVAGSYSSYALFSVSDPPVVTITSPTAGAVLATGQPTFVWTKDASTTQVSRRVVVTRTTDGVVVHDSGTTSTSILEYTPPVIILENGGAYSVAITVTDQHGMSTTTTHSFTSVYQAPEVVTFFLDETVFDTRGYVYIDWSQIAPDAFFVDWRVYRRPVESINWDLLQIITDPAVSTWKDWTASANVVYEYAVTQRAGRFGLVLESPTASTQSAIVEGTHYWILNPFDETDNIRLSHVVGDSFSDEYEEGSMVIIGRGRKVNHGTRYGYSGSLSVQLRDDDYGTARSKRLLLQKLKDARTSYYLRTPFGDRFEISLGNLGFERVAGVGTAEFLDVTIPYSEVF